MLIFCIGALLYRLQLLCLGCYLFGYHFVPITMPCQNVSYAHYQIPMKRTDQNYIKSMQLTFEVKKFLEEIDMCCSTFFVPVT